MRKLFTASATSTSTLNRIPTRVLKSFPNELSSLVLNLINFSWEKRFFPHALRQAIVKPHINLDPEDFANYRPISNLSYKSKLLERSSLVQLTDHLESNALFCDFHSAFRKFYSTENALLKVTNDMLLSLELKKSTFYTGLNLSAAFDTLDHEILLSILEVSLGFRGSVLFSKKLSEWLISKSIDKKDVFGTGKITGVLGPLLFSWYLLLLELINKQMQINYHFYADNTVIYFVYDKTVTQEKFGLIISTLQIWFCAAELTLNTQQTEFIKAVRNILFNANLKLPVDSKFSNHVNFLGFNQNDKLLFSNQISSVTSAC